MVCCFYGSVLAQRNRNRGTLTGGKKIMRGAIILLLMAATLACGNLHNAISTANDSSAQKSISAAEAKQHIGETATVCGVVASARFASNTRGQPTFLNLDEPYPRQIFTIVIWGSDRAKFGTPEQDYNNKRVCVTGKIQEFKGVPEIVAKEKSQISTR